MSTVDTLVGWLLRVAVRRWPAEVRAEQAREWHAELAALAEEHGPGPSGALARLRFAGSLATSPPLPDEHGVPRGWREAVGPLGTALRSPLLLALVGLLVAAAMEPLHGLASIVGGVRGSRTHLLFLLVAGVATGALCPVAGRLGRRAARAVAPARAVVPGVAALAVAFALAQLASSDYYLPEERGLLAVAALAAALAWTVLATAVVLATVRATTASVTTRGRWAGWLLAVAGTPLAVELATAVAALPPTLASGTGLNRVLWWAPELLSGPFQTQYLADSATTTFNIVSGQPRLLLVYTVLALAYGHGTTRRLPGVVAGTVAAGPTAVVGQVDPTQVTGAAGPVPGRPARAAGLVALVAAVAAWAYTVAGLTPAMPAVSRSAPMPGGDGELYLWVAELRWGAILLAGLGLLAAAAHRRAAPLAAGLLAAGLLGADAVLERGAVAGPEGLRVALVTGVLVAGFGWWVAGGVRHGTPDSGQVRRRLTVVAVVAAACGPLLVAQGTPTVNHQYLPPGLAGVTALLPGLLAVLAVLAAAAASHRPPPAAAVAVLAAVPAAVLVAAGIGTGTGIDQAVTGPVGFALAGPLTTLVGWVVRRRRTGTGWRVAVLGTLLTLGGLVATVPLVYCSMMASIFAANLLFALAGTGYPADGISLLPGAALLAVLLAPLVGRPADPATGGRPARTWPAEPRGT